jgi:hypothetical protein
MPWKKIEEENQRLSHRQVFTTFRTPLTACECGLVRAVPTQVKGSAAYFKPPQIRSPREAGLVKRLGTLVTGHHRELSVGREGFRVASPRLRRVRRKRLRNRRRRDLASGRGRYQPKLRRWSRRRSRVVVVFACAADRRQKAENSQRGCRQHSFHGRLL